MRHGHRDVGHNSTIIAGTVLLRDLGHVLYVDPAPLDYVNSELALLLGVNGWRHEACSSSECSLNMV